MRRFTPLNLAAALVVTALVAALVAAGAGAGAATQKRVAAGPAGAFRQALATKLGERLHKPAADVLAALKSAHRSLPAGRKARLIARANRLTARAHSLGAHSAHLRRARATRAHRRRDAWAAAVAGPLGVSPADVTAALRALVAERLDSLVHDGWLSEQRRDAELACFDDAGRCADIRRPPGLATLRAGL